jgi:hypothetical protein
MKFDLILVAMLVILGILGLWQDAKRNTKI